MDASTLRWDFKRKKWLEGPGNGDNEDKISNLPENILHHILSFLPTKDLVSTSVLSTVWKCLWTSIPYLDFCDSVMHSERMNEDKTIFMNFVERVLLLHDTPSIHKFCLSSSRTLDASRVNSWISFVIRRNVRELIVKINMEHPFVFPRSLFTCESLTVAKFELNSVLKIPASICFPSLRALHLKYVNISCDQTVQQVSLNCPALEELVIEDCIWVKIKTITISAPMLKSLIIEDHGENNNDIHCCEMEVYANNLISLDFTSNMSCELSLYNASSLVNAFVDIYISGINLGHRASKLLRGICNVKDLTLSDQAIVAFSYADLTSALLMFTNLKHMRVAVNYDTFDDEYLTELFRYLPNIESLHFGNGLNGCESNEHGWELETTPQCFLSHLKLVELECFEGNENELHFVTYLLKNASALERIFIVSSSTLSEDATKQMEITKQLLMLPRGSICCVIDFS